MSYFKKSKIALIIVIIILTMNPLVLFAQENNERRILVSDYRDKMMAGWIGQMAGVGWGAPTEFKFTGVIIPEDKVPEWKPEMVNVFGQDDLYVEMTFLKTLEDFGFDVSINQAGIDFANSGYMLWHANRAGRENLRKKIAPPNSGHPQFSKHADDIDYQIEADYSGLIAPGLPNTVIELGEKFGKIMNYGDGVYGGQFVGGLYAEAFFEDDPIQLVKSALKYIPEGSQYAEAVRDVMAWHKEDPNDWISTWELINEKYHKNPQYRQFTCADNSEDGSTLKISNEFNIDAKLNGAYIVMGLLYGNDDLDETTVVSMRCGQDSDCNPSNAAGALFTTRGYKNLPEKYISALDLETKFSFTDYTFPELVDVTEELATQAIIRAGGRVEINANGEKEFVIPIIEPKPSVLEQSYNPGPISDNVFSKEELKKFDGHWLFKFTLVFLLLLSFVLLKENRNVKTAVILIPLSIVVAIGLLFRSSMDPEILGMLDIALIFIALATSITILLLLADKIKNTNWVITIITAVVVMGIVGYTGIIGCSEGRIIASTKNALTGFTLFGVIWLLSVVVATLLNRKKFKRSKFNILLIVSLFIISTIAMYFVANMLWFLGTNFAFITIAGLVIALVLYILTLPFLVLFYKSSEYDGRLMNWLKIKQNN